MKRYTHFFFLTKKSFAVQLVDFSSVTKQTKMFLTPKQCWEHVKTEYCQQYAYAYRQYCDAWFVKHNETYKPCFYRDVDAHNTANVWSTIKFNFDACEYMWSYDRVIEDYTLFTLPWNASSPTENVRLTKCRRTTYKYPEFESLW